MLELQYIEDDVLVCTNMSEMIDYQKPAKMLPYPNGVIYDYGDIIIASKMGAGVSVGNVTPTDPSVMERDPKVISDVTNGAYKTLPAVLDGVMVMIKTDTEMFNTYIKPNLV